MELTDAKQLALSLMTEHSLNDWRFDFNNTLGSFGICHYTKRTIFLSSILTPALQESEVKNTILHEIAHALVGSGHGHDDVWQKKALEIGCDGQRCNSYDINESQIRFKYLATCPMCGKAVGTSRLPKRKHWHNGCRHSFKPEYELKYIQQF